MFGPLGYSVERLEGGPIGDAIERYHALLVPTGARPGGDASGYTGTAA
jgi:hypothetical protein